MSLLLRAPPPLLPLAAAVAVCDVAGERRTHQVAERHRRGDRRRAGSGTARAGQARRGLAKLAGILVEGRPQEDWAVLGIGLNVAVRLDQLPAELRAGGDDAGAAPQACRPPRSGLAARRRRADCSRC